MSCHLTHHSGKTKSIAVNIALVTDNGIRALGFSVGINDATAVTSTLERHPFPNVEIIMHSKKRSNKQACETRLRQHWTVSQQSTAF